METFCTSGEAERVKGAVHGAAGTLVGVMAVYNAVAWWYRRERHLGVNAVLYTAGFLWEVYQTNRHLRRRIHVGTETFRAHHSNGNGTRAVHDVEPCTCGEGFCWCGGAESMAGGLAHQSQFHRKPGDVEV